MNSKKTRIYHKRLAKSITKINDIVINLEISKNDFYRLNKLILSIKSEGDNLIGETNPEIKDNVAWYYGKFRK